MHLTGDNNSLNWSSCEWINAFMNDRVHPSPYGNQLFSDMMTLLLGETEAHVDMIDMHKGDLPLQPFDHRAVDEKLMLCVDAMQYLIGEVTRLTDVSQVARPRGFRGLLAPGPPVPLAGRRAGMGRAGG